MNNLPEDVFISSRDKDYTVVNTVPQTDSEFLAHLQEAEIRRSQ